MGLKEKWKKSKVVNKVKQVKMPEREKSSVRKDNTKRTTFFVWTFILGMFAVATLSFLLSVNTRSHLNETNENLFAMEDTEVVEEISQEQANQFLSSFVREYINVPSDSEMLEERAKKLKEYMVYNDTFNNDKNTIYRPDGKGTRNLKSFTLFNIEENESSTIYQYKVTFANELKTEVETGKGKNKKTEMKVEEEEQTLLINIPIVVEDGLFSIPSVPYFTEVPSLAGNIEYEKGEVEFEEYNGNHKEDLLVFLNTFFEKYATEPIDEMGYLMDNPQSLNGSFSFDEIQDVRIYQEEKYRVILQVVFRNNLTNIQQANDVEMVVSKNENNFFVEEFNYN